MTRDEMRLFLIEQARAGKLGAYTHEGCVYRHGDKRCAVGAMLTEEQLDIIETDNLNTGTTVITLCQTYPEFFRGIPFTSGELLGIQEVHDRMIGANEGSEVFEDDLNDLFESWEVDNGDD